MKLDAGSLSDYLSATLKVATEHSETPPHLMFMVRRMDEIFHQEIFGHEFEANPTVGLLAMNAYVTLLSAVRQALSGHVVSTFPIARAALESACYALLARDEIKAEIWADRHTSELSLKACRRTFTAQKAADELRAISPQMAEYVMAHYEASIDFGAHPNRKSVIDHLEDSGPAGDGLHGFELIGVYGSNSWQVNHALLACVEAGQAIAFLMAAAAENHPLINERLGVIQGWMDAKRQVLEELSGGPLDYSGPMYRSVIPPT
ncbi:hypothetical protein QQ994_19020 [Pseudomonas asiatica]|uniref:hypothetical protein n=1 Tax=Pseudomonas asiatica TaxID=2219225 RepID=UPI0025703BDA|nr:hypothetical protein [Pseudomonas asiatica]WJD68702.1 hypothetical protein QQ994_19020 [Pseudomonas asiatica]